jgi:hypothetical protein
MGVINGLFLIRKNTLNCIFLLQGSFWLRKRNSPNIYEPRFKAMEDDCVFSSCFQTYVLPGQRTMMMTMLEADTQDGPIY